MPLKDILLHLDDGRGHEARLTLAAELAGRHGAHLTGLFVIEPLGVAGLAMPGGADFAMAEAIQEMEQRHREARHKVAKVLGAAFKAACERAGVVSEWRVVVGDAASVATLHARYADLAIVGQRDPDHPPFSVSVAEPVLMGSGRPVLVVPFIGTREAIGQRVLMAWNASREAARAVNDALPLFAAGGTITILSINPARGIGGEGDLPAADIAHHLARHGAKAEAAYTVAEDISVGDAILSHAADLGADLIVMGAYGHSRAREFVLGGATRALLAHMTVPVLLSH
jgi:nucleotide-binding universal stress UspA family protein